MQQETASGVTLRAAVPADAPCIGVLAAQVFLDNYSVGGIRPVLAREVLQILSSDLSGDPLTRADKRFVVAEAAGHLRGFAEVTLDARHPLLPEGPAAELNRLYVQEPFTGTGLGTALLQRAESLAAAAGATMLWLTAWVHNHRAVAFYGRRGYRDAGATVYRFEDQEHPNRLFTRNLNNL